MWVKLALLGMVAGTVTASTGIGWGLIVMPSLLLGFQFAAPVAVRMTILGLIGLNAVVASREIGAATVSWVYVLALLVGGMVGGVIGILVTDVVPAKVLEKGIGAATVLAGLAIIFWK